MSGNALTYDFNLVSLQRTSLCSSQRQTAWRVNWGASASPMNAPEGNMWNIRQGIVLSAGFAMTRMHNIYV